MKNILYLYGLFFLNLIIQPVFAQPNVTATLGERTDGVLISWSTSKLNYRVLRSESDDFSKSVQILGWQKGLTYFDKTAKKGVLYYYFVQSSSSTNSTSALVNNKGAKGFVGVVANFIATKGETNKTVVNWVGPKLYSYFKLYSSSDKNFTNAKELTGWTTESIYHDMKAEKGKSIFYFLKLSKDKTGVSCILADDIAEGYIGLPNPTLNASGEGYGKDNNIHLNFSNDLEKKYFYQILRSPDAYFKNAKAITSWVNSKNTQLSFTDLVPKYSTAYYYFVLVSYYSNGKNPSLPTSPKMAYAGNQQVWNLKTSHTPTYNYFRVTYNSLSGQYMRLYRGNTKDSTKAVAITDWLPDVVLEDKSSTSKYGQPFFYWIVSSINRGEKQSIMTPVGIGYRLLNTPYSNNISKGTFNDKITMTIIPGWSDKDPTPFFFKIWKGSTSKPSNLTLVRDWNSSLTFTDNISPNGSKQFYYFFEASRFRDGSYPSKLSATGTVGWVKNTSGFVEINEPGMDKYSSYPPYPNPARDFVKIPGIISENKVNLFDQLGNLEKSLISQQDFESVNIINVSGLKRGIYYLRFSNSEGEILTNRVVLE